MFRKPCVPEITITLLGLLLFAASGANAGTLARRDNLVSLIENAEIILHGDVVEVTDGIENALPYTQVTVKVRETLRGSTGPVYTFRQFGLRAPRSTGTGLVNYTVSPEGWPTFRANEEVILFLYKAAKRSGLRTTVGLGQGKFAVQAGRLTSQQANAGLFDGVVVDGSLVGDADKQVLATGRGPVSAGAFLSLVRRAVQGQWIETRRMSNAK